MSSRAADFRAGARNSLRGFWGFPLLVCLLGGIMSGGVTVPMGTNFTLVHRFSIDGGDNFAYHFDAPYYMSDFIRYVWPMLAAFAVVFILIGIALTFVAGATQLGMCSYFSRLTLGQRPPFHAMFSGFRVFWKAAGLLWFQTLFIWLWSLLFIVPGIIAAYRYAMAPYLMAEHPEIGVREAMDRSKEMMKGNKGRLFCLGISFIGWDFLSILTLGILQLWITPYRAAAFASFYMELTGRPYGFPTPPEGSTSSPNAGPQDDGQRPEAI